MKYYFVLLFVLLFQFCCACRGSEKNRSQKSSEGSVENIQQIASSEVKYPILFEYNRKYPQKEIYLQDIADVSYSKFSGKDVLFEQGSSRKFSVSDKFKIIANPKGGTVFVFDNNNQLINKFNHVGGGPEEYQSISKLCVDFDANEIFIFDFHLKYRVKVYSFDGKYKRELKIKQPLWIESALDYDRENILVCFRVYKSEKNINKIERQYYLLSKENGLLISIDINIKYPISNRVITTNSNGHMHQFGVPVNTIVGNGNDFMISDYGSDTIYLKNKKGLFPFIIKSPSVEDSNEPILIYVISKTDKYTFLQKIIRRRENNGMTNFIVDNLTGEIFEVKIKNRDFPSKNTSIETFDMDHPKNTTYDLLRTSSFIEYNEENLLYGKLKEFVSTLTEDDNDFLISIKYK